MISDVLISAIGAAFRKIKELVRVVIAGILNFAKEVVGWFRNLKLDHKKDTPFVGDARKLKDMLKTAPRRKVGIFEGVYNEETDEITAHRYIDADELDSKTKGFLADEPLIVLS